MKNRGFSLLILVVLECILMSTLNLVPSVMAKDAYVERMAYNAKVRAKIPDTWIFTVQNIDCAENSDGEAWFFFKFFLDGQLWWDEYDFTSYRTWQCNKGNNVTLGYKIEGWNVIEPVFRDARVDLYWSNNGEFQLVDSVSFNIAITIVAPLQHIRVFSYLTVYLFIGFLLLSYYYVSGLGLEE